MSADFNHPIFKLFSLFHQLNLSSVMVLNHVINPKLQPEVNSLIFAKNGGGSCSIQKENQIVRFFSIQNRCNKQVGHLPDEETPTTVYQLFVLLSIV